MQNQIVFEGKKPETYAETILFYLANSQNHQLIISEFVSTIAEIDSKIMPRQVHALFSNFKRMDLLKTLNKGLYQIDSDKLKEFARHYVANKGKVSIWGGTKISRQRSYCRNAKSLDTARAIFAAYDKPLSFKDVVNIAGRYNLKLTYSTASKLKYGNGSDLLTEPLRDGNNLRYSASPAFFKNHVKKINYFIDLLPHRKSDILARFNKFVPESVKQYLHVSQEPSKSAEVKPEQKNNLNIPTPLLKFRSVDIARAIFIAYDGPLSVKDVFELSAQHGHPITRCIIGWYRNNKSDELIPATGKTQHGGMLYKISPDFCKINLSLLPIFIKILPDESQTLIERFKKDLSDDIVQDFLKDQGLDQPEKKNLDSGKPLDIKIEEKNEDQQAAADQQIASQQAAEDRQATKDQLSASNNHDQQEDFDAIDAANVGAAMIAYINKLKFDLRTLKAEGPPAQDEGLIADLNRKNENLAAAVVGLKAERNNYQFQVSKLEKIVEEKDRRLMAKDKRIEELERKLETSRTVHIPKSFKMSEVARMTNLIKGDRIR